jgi:peptidoglycan hydrolase-like protein with peptidoglycan-binding domain
VVLVFWLAVPAFPVTRKTSRSSTKTAVSKKTASRKSAAARRRAKLTHQTWRTGQMVPTPDRYKQIQEALAARGYSNQTPDGVWGPQWTDSLKRLQQDQKLEPSGKITSLSLLALGLGPRRDSSGPPAAAPPSANESPQPVTRESQ